MGWPEMPSRRAVYRFCRDTGDAAPGVLFLSLADHLATRGPNLGLDGWKLHTSIARHVIAWQEEQPEPPRRLIDGYDIMNFFGLKPGQRLGQILESVREAQASGEIVTREEALSLVAEILAEPTAGRPETEER
jgi:poly(A) polymerase